MSKRKGTLASIAVIAILLLSGLMVIGTNNVAADPAPLVPDAPTGLTATAGANQMTLSWTVPVSNGGADIDYYSVYVETDDSSFNQPYVAVPSIPVNETIWRVGVDLPSDQTVLKVTITDLPFLRRGLDDRWIYNFTVAAHNMFGTGPKSESVLANSYTIPNREMPDIIPGDGKAFLEWGLYG